jgi:hypothetical protein
MRSLLARLAVLGAFAVTLSACSNGSGTSLPFAGPPNQGGATSGTFQSGSNGQTLLRFLDGSPDAAAAAVDVCVDNQPWGTLNARAVYGGFATGLYAVTGGITHTVSVYPGLVPGTNAGLECSTAPGPYFGTSAIAVTTLTTPGNANRWSIVLGGTKGSGTLGLYVYADPLFPTGAAGPEVISHNAAPAFDAGPPAKRVGFGQCTTTVTPCAAAVVLTGAGNVAAPTPSSQTGSVQNGVVVSGIAGIPAGFYDGTGVAAGNPVPITSIAAPAAVAGQPYVVQLYAFDGPAGGLNLIGVVEQTLGFGF